MKLVGVKLWWIFVVLSSSCVSAESPELQKIPTLGKPSTQSHIQASDYNFQAESGYNELEYSDVCRRTTAKYEFLSILDGMRSSLVVNNPTLLEPEARHIINPPWSRYITPLVEYLYYGDSRHSVFYDSQDGKSNSLRESERMTEADLIKRASQPKQKVNCTVKQNSTSMDKGVLLVNDTSLQQLLRNEKPSNGSSIPSRNNAVCQILLLFAPWCPFSAKLAPHYNALGRIFPDLEALAINAVTLNYWNARFGTVAVPNVLLFHNGKFVAKYNYTEKNIDSLTYFVQNVTNLTASGEVKISEEDFLGPVPTELVDQTDYYLILSWLVIVYALAFGCYKHSAPFISFYNHIVNIFNYDHNHLD